MQSPVSVLVVKSVALQNFSTHPPRLITQLPGMLSWFQHSHQFPRVLRRKAIGIVVKADIDVLA